MRLWTDSRGLTIRQKIHQQQIFSTSLQLLRENLGEILQAWVEHLNPGSPGVKKKNNSSDKIDVAQERLRHVYNVEFILISSPN